VETGFPQKQCDNKKLEQRFAFVRTHVALEEAVVKSPELRTPKSRYLVRDLRTLTDAVAMELVAGLDTNRCENEDPGELPCICRTRAS
jgi:hypothetical protein